MAGIQEILSRFFGSKSDRDIRTIMPIVHLVKEEFARLEKTSNDELRAKTLELKKFIQDYISEEVYEIEKLKNKAENEISDISEKQEIFEQIDKIEIKISEKIEKALNDILPKAFAIVKETAKGF